MARLSQALALRITCNRLAFAMTVAQSAPPPEAADLEALKRLGLVRHPNLGHGPGLCARTGPRPRCSGGG